MSDQSPETSTVDVPGGTVQAKLFSTESTGRSSAPPLLFLHGGPGGSCSTFALFEALADERDIIMFDQLGSATSTWDEAADASQLWNIDRFCEEVDAVRAAFGLDEVVLFGHSWGGWLGTDYLCRQPSGVGGAVLANTAASFPSFADSIDRRVQQLSAPSVEAVTDARSTGDVDSDSYRAAAIEFYRSFVIRNVDSLDPGNVFDRQRAATVFRYMQGADELHADGSLANWDRRGDLGNIDVPVLVISGEYDHMDGQCSGELVAGIPQSSNAHFEQSSHCPHLEQPDDVLAAVRTWLNGLA